MNSDYARGLITVLIGIPDQIIIATDRTEGKQTIGRWSDIPRAVELRPGLIVCGCGIWVTADDRLNAPRAIRTTYEPPDTPSTFLSRYDRTCRKNFETFLTEGYLADPAGMLRDYFSPVTSPHALLVCDACDGNIRLTTFEYTPRMTDDGRIELSPLTRTHEPVASRFAAIGAAATRLNLLDDHYVDAATSGEHGPELAARFLIEQAISRMPTVVGPPKIYSFSAREAANGNSRAPIDRPLMHPDVARPFPPVDTRDIRAVEGMVLGRFATMYPGVAPAWLSRLFADVNDLFNGRNPAYAAIDVRYHDLEHTLQATLCAALILEGRHIARVSPRLEPHAFELTIAAALLHDSGYLRLKSDTGGTGAKYTFCHVLRSCAFAASYLPTIGANSLDVRVVTDAISCTGPNHELAQCHFSTPVDELIACTVVTADFVGQMAAADYPNELSILFEEFEESDDFVHALPDERAFVAVDDLIAKTPTFWRNFVRPKLETNCQALYRFLARPAPYGPNDYTDAIEANIAQIERNVPRRLESTVATGPVSLAAH